MTRTSASDRQSLSLERICGDGPVIAVLDIRDTSTARELGEALVAGGVRVLEITLRSPGALDAIRAMSAIEGAIVGAGTIVAADQVEAVVEAGAVFGVSPGVSTIVVEACGRAGLPLLPGVATASEVMGALEHGLHILKFFPAEAAGGPTMLRALHGPFPSVKFCPTGGLTRDNTATYLELPNVVCAGGSWVAPASAVENRDWDDITKLARTATNLR